MRSAPNWRASSRWSAQPTRKYTTFSVSAMLSHPPFSMSARRANLIAVSPLAPTGASPRDNLRLFATAAPTDFIVHRRPPAPELTLFAGLPSCDRLCARISMRIPRLITLFPPPPLNIDPCDATAHCPGRQGADYQAPPTFALPLAAVVLAPNSRFEIGRAHACALSRRRLIAPASLLSGSECGDTLAAHGVDVSIPVPRIKPFDARPSRVSQPRRPDRTGGTSRLGRLPSWLRSAFYHGVVRKPSE